MPNQQLVYTTTINQLTHKKRRLCYLNIQGGTGKIVVTYLVLAKVQQKKEITLAVASFGIAKTLLSGSRTPHAAFMLHSI